MAGPEVVSHISSDPLFPIDGMTKLIMKALYPYLGAVFVRRRYFLPIPSYANHKLDLWSPPSLPCPDLRSCCYVERVGLVLRL